MAVNRNDFLHVRYALQTWQLDNQDSRGANSESASDVVTDALPVDRHPDQHQTLVDAGW